MRLNLQLLGTKEFNKSPSEAGVAERVQDWVDSRVDPQKPKRSLVPELRDALAVAASTDDHQESVRCPANPKNAHDDCQGFGHFLVSREPEALSCALGHDLHPFL